MVLGLRFWLLTCVSNLQYPIYLFIPPTVLGFPAEEALDFDAIEGRLEIAAAGGDVGFLAVAGFDGWGQRHIDAHVRGRDEKDLVAPALALKSRKVLVPVHNTF